jgi:hypothetical protein
MAPWWGHRQAHPARPTRCRGGARAGLPPGAAQRSGGAGSAGLSAQCDPVPGARIQARKGEPRAWGAVRAVALTAAPPPGRGRHGQ